MADDASDIDNILAKEDSELARDIEIERILNAFPLDSYSVLDLQPGVSLDDIKATFKKKSLLIHPDKTSNPRAPDAFDRLKKAQNALQDDATREMLDNAFTDARRILIRERKWTINDERLKSDEFLRDWREKTKEVLVENELRKRKLKKIQMEEEGRQKRKMEQEMEEKRLQRAQEKAWEDSRDTRVHQWREYRKNRNAALAAATKAATISSTTPTIPLSESSGNNNNGNPTANDPSANKPIPIASSAGVTKKKKKTKKLGLQVLG